MEYIVFGATILSAIIGYLLKQGISLVLTQCQENKAAIAKLDEAIAYMQKDLNDLHIYLANNYVAQEDFLREIVRYENLLKLIIRSKNDDEPQ